jgi:hypothetical protein
MTDLKICFLFLYFGERSSAKMEEYERLLLKEISYARADEVWRSWYKIHTACNRNVHIDVLDINP